MNNYKEPLDLLKQRIGQEVYIRLRNGTELDARLVAYDEHVNLMLQNVKIKRPQASGLEEKKLMYLRGDAVVIAGHR